MPFVRKYQEFVKSVFYEKYQHIEEKDDFLDHFEEIIFLSISLKILIFEENDLYLIENIVFNYMTKSINISRKITLKNRFYLKISRRRFLGSFEKYCLAFFF